MLPVLLLAPKLMFDKPLIADVLIEFAGKLIEEALLKDTVPAAEKLDVAYKGPVAYVPFLLTLIALVDPATPMDTFAFD